MKKFKVVNPVHETFFESDSGKECVDWIDTFAKETGKPAVRTGNNTYKVGDFTFIVFEGAV